MNLNLQEDKVFFSCDECGEFIDSSSEVCRFCGNTLDEEKLNDKIQTQKKSNSAYNDANNLKILGIACLAISFPRSLDDLIFGYFTNSYVNYFPHGLILLFAFFLTGWQYRFGRLKIETEDFQEAKKNRNTGVYLWVLSIFLVFVLVPVIEGLVFSLF